MSTQLFHFLTIVGKAGEDAAREISRLSGLVVERRESEHLEPDLPAFTNLCKGLLLTRFEPEAIHYSCYKSGYGIGNLGVSGIADEACGDNAVRDLNWAATFYPHTCSTACFAIANAARAKAFADGARVDSVWYEDMLARAIEIGIVLRVPFHVFVILECTGPSAEDDETIRKSVGTSFDELHERARRRVAYMPATARGDYGVVQ